MYDENNNNSSGNKGKFSERLKKMRRDRLRIKKYGTLEEEDKFTLKDTGRNILKFILAMPSVVYSHVVDSDKKDLNIDNKKRNKEFNKTYSNKGLSAVDENSYGSNVRDNNNVILNVQDLAKKHEYSEEIKKIKVKKIKDMDVSLLKKNREYLLKHANFDGNLDTKKVVSNIDVELNKTKLQKEIIDLIKKRLVKSINELEILHSELYVLNELGNGEIYLSECQQDVKEIKRLLSKINSLKEKYDYLKDNVDFEYMLEYGDDFLIDKILELKEICTRDDIRQTVDDYKILDEYKFLYLKIDKLQEDTVKFEEYKNNKVEELKQRDIDFDKLKDDLYDVDRENERYDSFVERQEMLLRELDDKVNKIDSYERVTYRLKGFNQLLGNSFKYLGLLLVNPLKGLIPGIATQTLITKNMISNLYNNLEWEENRRMVYDAIDYSVSIDAAINSLDDTSSLIDSTLEDIVKLKNKYEREFSQYEGAFSSYKDAIKKLNKIENSVLGNKIKIETMKTRIKEKEKQNTNKLKMVKKLNSSSNN